MQPDTETMIKRYSPIAVRERVERLDARVGRITHGVSKGTGARAPVAIWEVAVTERIDIAGVERSGYGKDVLLVLDLGVRIDRRGDAASEK